MAGEEANQFFLALLAQHEFLGLVGLGKIADPSTNKAEVDLQKTRVAIGTLSVLEEKTRGQLTSVEERELRRILTGLRLNYVEELARARDQASAQAGASASEEKAQSPTGNAKPATGNEKPATGNAKPASDAASENPADQPRS